MSMLADVQQPSSQGKGLGTYGPILTGVWQKVAIGVWVILFVVSLISFALSVVSLNIWDRVPAAELTRYFPLMDQQAIASRTDFQNEVRSMGFSLAGFAFLLTAVRVIGSLPVFVLSVLLVRRYSHQLMAVLFAMLMAVVGGAGMWNNTLFGWASALAPWMNVAGQVLNLLLWMGVIMLYAFPDGHFTPRWTIALAILVIPLAISLVFDLQFFLNPATWPQPLDLLPNFLFIGVALFSVLYRYMRRMDPDRKERFKGFVWGIALLIGYYFILLVINDLYGDLTGHMLWTTNRALVLSILVTEPVWFALEFVFGVLTIRSIFRDRLLDL